MPKPCSRRRAARAVGGRHARAVLASAAVMVVTAVVAGTVHGADSGDVSGQVGRLVGAALSTLPAVWVVLAVALLLYGVLRASPGCRRPPSSSSSCSAIRRPARPARLAHQPVPVRAPAGDAAAP